jgi:subtilisin family serine protease
VNAPRVVAQSAPHGALLPGKLVVRLSREVDPQRVARDHGLKLLAHIPGTRIYQFGVPMKANQTVVARQLGKDARIRYAEPDALSLSEARSGVASEQFHIAFVDGFDSSGYVNQAAYTQVDFTPGQTGSGPGVGLGTIVAILDTGATFTHPALQGHYLPGLNLVRPNTPPDDINDGQQNLAVGHGTMVAGIIAMLDPSAQILPVRVLNGDGVGSIFNVVQGIYYAIGQGAQVINMSLGTSRNSCALQDAVLDAEDAGVILVASAGNDGANELHYPAAYPGVLAVAALEADNTLASFSNFGPTIAAAAPGDGIESTYYNGGYATWAGTSFSAPFLTGEASLFLEKEPNCPPDDFTTVVWLSSNSIDSLNSGFAGLLGAGVLDVAVSLNY